MRSLFLLWDAAFFHAALVRSDLVALNAFEADASKLEPVWEFLDGVGFWLVAGIFLVVLGVTEYVQAKRRQKRWSR